MTDRLHAGIAVYAVLFVVAVLTARWWSTPVRDTAPYDDGAVTVETPIAELMGDWEPVYGIALERARGGRT